MSKDKEAHSLGLHTLKETIKLVLGWGGFVIVEAIAVLALWSFLSPVGFWQRLIMLPVTVVVIVAVVICVDYLLGK